MEIKRVKVTKAYHSSYWYANKIGEEFTVFDVDCGIDNGDRFRHRVVHIGIFDDKLPLLYLDSDDFDVLEVFYGEIIEKTLIYIQRKDTISNA